MLHHSQSPNHLVNLALSLLIALGAVGCGGGGSSSGSSDDTPAAVKAGTLPTAGGPVYFLNQVGSEVDTIFKREVAYTEQQFTRDVDPRWGIDAHAVEYFGDPDPDKLTVILRSGEAMDDGLGNKANTLIFGNWAYVQWNSTTIGDGTAMARCNHGALDLAKFPLGQTYEAIDYNPVDFTQTKLDGWYWLCDWPIPDGCLDAFGKMGSLDFIGAKKK